jgi:RimJ/RimL family protein N-acetyltransferase
MSDAMSEDISARYPRTVEVGPDSVELRMMTGADESAVLDFASALPKHDLLFLQRDISAAPVMAAWVREIEAGHTPSLLAILRGKMGGDGKIVGCSAVISDPHSFSSHVGEVRVILAADARTHGLGRLLVQESFLLALSLGLEKLTARMTADQEAAIKVFEDLGFRAEALLKNHVRDADDTLHDLVVLSHDVAAVQGKMALYGLDEAF